MDALLALPLVVVAALLVVLLGALLVALALHSRRRRPVEAGSGEALEPEPVEESEESEQFEEAEEAAQFEEPEEPEEPEELEDGVAASGEIDEVESATVRALRAQIRTLEEALETADAEPVPVVTYRDLVAVAVRAVAQRTTGEDDQQYVAARTAAAIARLDQPDTLTRTLLPTVPGRTGAAPSVAPPQILVARPEPSLSEPVLRTLSELEFVEPELVEPELVELGIAEPEPAQPEPAETDVEDDELEIGGQAPATDPPETEVVLPVPPPAVVEPTRGRRRLRHRAA